ncbi:MAG: hypothetical protein GW808_11025 [Sphingomonadales bacterium]|nr:hypothetical protein [Sphingomonadales bacterium]PIX66290.1 MAG: hypothetical protein COZ43_07415 [Sphingomonadales bacterium CG_4_10_14_3_um_filter_58_15]NCO48598.1 hypothetical protein [Sphingomonadales bacterium]NCO98706.1 hypothetical protein [Sphingomonadales bacterium]NCP43644.1 hypothetical protein [Sphingomonadales bacterium]
MFYLYLEDILIVLFTVLNSMLIAAGVAAWVSLKFANRSTRFIKLIGSCFAMIPYFALFLIELAELQQCLNRGGTGSTICAFPVATIRWNLLILAIPIGFPLAWLTAHLALGFRKK